MPAGRPRTLDEDTILDAAGRIWWREGVHRVSLNDLASALQVAKPSLARAFGGKEAMIGKALARYGEQARLEIASAITSAENVGELARRYLEHHVDMQTRADAPLGCFIAGASNECAAVTEGPVREALDQAASKGRALLLQRLEAVGAQQPEQITTFLLAQTLAMSQMARGGASREELMIIVGLAVQAVDHPHC